MFFFFQAEDGIRDIGVTGVQTCALPICVRGLPLEALITDIGPEGRLSDTQASRVGSLAQGEEGLGQRLVFGTGGANTIAGKIGRASCRGRGEISVVAGLLKKKKNSG